MITEDDLTRLMAEAAASAPPPGSAPDALLAAVAAGPDAPASGRRPGSARARRVLAAAAAVVVVTVFAVGAVTSSEDRRDGPTETAVEEASGADDAAAPTTMPAGGDGTGAGAGTAGGGGAGAGERGRGPADAVAGEPLRPSTDSATGVPQPDAAASAAPAQPGLQDGAKVVKTGAIDLEVAEGSFDRAVERVTAEVIGLDGYLAEQTTSQGDGAQSGSLVVRVPEASFEALLTSLRELGDVQSVTSKGTDVTAQYTDLEARLGALVATRDRLRTVLAEATTVTDILMVQDRITAVQAEIESYEGQLRLLDDQTSMATLAVTLAEPGAETLAVSAAGDGGLGGAWDDARRRFGDGLEAIVGWSGLAALALVVIGAGWLVGRAAAPRLRRRLL